MKKSLLSAIILIVTIIPATSSAFSLYGLFGCGRQIDDQRQELYHEKYYKGMYRKLHDANESLAQGIYSTSIQYFPAMVLNSADSELVQIVANKGQKNTDALKKEIQAKLDEKMELHKSKLKEGTSIIVSDVKYGDNVEVEYHIKRDDGSILKYNGVVSKRYTSYSQKKTLRSVDPKVNDILKELNVDTTSITLEEAIRLAYRNLDYIRDTEIMEKAMVSERCYERLMRDYGDLVDNSKDSTVYQGARSDTKVIDSQESAPTETGSSILIK